MSGCGKVRPLLNEKFDVTDGPTPLADGLNGATTCGIKKSRRSPDVTADACRGAYSARQGSRHDPPSVSQFPRSINDGGMTVPTDPGNHRSADTGCEQARGQRRGLLRPRVGVSGGLRGTVSGGVPASRLRASKER